MCMCARARTIPNLFFRVDSIVLYVLSCINIYSQYIKQSTLNYASERNLWNTMFLTNILLKKAKSKHVLVLAESLVSGHRVVRKRERVADKLEFVFFDPYVQQKTLYKEKKKLCSI